MTISVNEGTTSHHSLSVFDKDGAVVVPESLRYRVTAGDGSVLIDWTTVSATSTEIELGAAINTISKSGNRRHLTVEATHNSGETITAEIEYALTNLMGVP